VPHPRRVLVLAARVGIIDPNRPSPAQNPPFDPILAALCQGTTSVVPKKALIKRVLTPEDYPIHSVILEPSRSSRREELTIAQGETLGMHP
jgi:hypothetical protein